MIPRNKHNLITSPRRIAKVIGFVDSNIRKSYLGREDKLEHLKALDVYTWIVENKVSEDELLFAVSTIRITKKSIKDSIWEIDTQVGYGIMRLSA